MRNFATNIKPIPKEIVDVWLERARESGWYVKDRIGNIIRIDQNSWRLLLTGFARNYTKWEKRNKARDAKASGVRNKPRPISISDRERKKPSWMTWEQWQFEEAERMQNHRRNERVEQINEALKKVRKEFGIC